MVIPKILLVNDDPSTLIALKSILNLSSAEYGYEILVAESGEEALRLVLSHQFAVIFLDISMPGIDGFETAQLIHSRILSASTPIIFITAYYADEINRLKGYELGAVDFLLTPIIPQILRTKAEVFVELAKKNMILESKTEELAELNRDLKVKQMLGLKRHNKALQIEVEDRKLAELRAHDLATKDSLTGLLNRRSVIEGLERCVSNAVRRNEFLAVMFLDMDRFKTINDTLGHDIGDQLLIQAAQRIESSVRENDLVARLGGDEFVIVVNNMASALDAVKIANKISASTEDSFLVGSHSVRVTLSIGISLFPQDGNSAHTLMKNADVAMYHTKKEKNGAVQFYSAELNSKLIAHQSLEQELHLALSRNEFILYYQPKVNAITNKIVSLEALIRWNHPVRGLLESHEFIDTAIECGIVVKIGDWVIRSTCEQIHHWQNSALTALNVPIAVNVAIPQINADLIVSIDKSLSQFKVSPDYLQLEITESLLIGDLDRTRLLLQEVSDRGITIAIDDFGTGYSSLSVLKSLPIDILKIDQSFINNIENDVNDSIIVSAIINMGHALGLLIVAEGIETVQQLEIIKKLDCDEYQGYLYSKPLSPQDLEKHVSEFDVLEYANE
jgi:diguanylate cyclase (GGDEF)-like protein